MACESVTTIPVARFSKRFLLRRFPPDPSEIMIPASSSERSFSKMSFSVAENRTIPFVEYEIEFSRTTFFEAKFKAMALVAFSKSEPMIVLALEEPSRMTP